MKKIIIITFIFLASGFAADAQNGINSQHLVKTNFITAGNLFENGRYNSVPPDNGQEDYLKKSRNQKTGAWILMGAGVAAIVTGIIIEAGNAVDNTYSLFTEESTNNTGVVIAVVGGCMAIGSIPLFAASSRNKKKANVSISNQKTGFGVPSNVNKSITCITMHIPIGK